MRRSDWFSSCVACVGVVGFAALAACGGDAASPPSSDDGQVMLSLSVVPADVQCLRVTVTGTERAAVRTFDVSGGQSFMQSLSGLPLGTVTFQGEAFAGACPSITGATIPSWNSEAITTSIVLGRLSSVALVMQRNGRAKLDVSFSDEPACSAESKSCRVDSECCSHACTRGVCEGTADGGAPAAP